MNILRRLFGRVKEVPEVEEENIPAIPEEPPESSHIVIPGVQGVVETALPADDGLGKTHKLPSQESDVLQESLHITYGQSTDIGMVRNNNQDSILTFFSAQGNNSEQPDFGLFVVADGMGGHHDGEKASAVASQILAMLVTQNIYGEGYAELDPGELNTRFSKAVIAANDMVVEQVPEGGTTITAAITINNLAHFAHVGDSRAYLITKEYEFEQITRDHSLVQRLIELDQLTPEEAEHHPQKNVLYRALGQSDSLEVDTATRRLPRGAHLLLCSDGLWNMIPQDTILDIVRNAPTPQMSCDRLVAAANEHGGADNISVVLIKMPD